ncbi:TIM barrel protein [Terriglobus saanensis]|uniref:Xylose isomerase domain-containing protein TIM barrel n=1 Tax=Terriglobus saanensis (strain ATCC BAA-1853 / DSM 23119 / SP1PR4) TaxID=401053 RepID=E8V6W6_TERSS|nr:TIM barrel protein [Terriglobus saanensis]ADV84990.1 Xylose isomerase domain-containing protein TIM barrel [Terriglobus saanensis SP1PR4]
MHRRDFTRTLAALAATAALPKFATAQAQQAAIRFSVMLWTLNKISPTEKSIELVAQAGYQGVELVGEWQKWSPADYARITSRTRALSLTIDSMAGVRGFADPATKDQLLADLAVALEAAKRLNCPQIILTSGKRTAASSHEACIEILKPVTDLAAKADKQVVIEPIDLLENPTSYLTSVTEAAEISRAINNPHLRVLYDLYHEQRQGGNLIEKIEKNIDQIALFHIASVPGRHEPSTGEVRYEAAYRRIAELKYNGFIAMEFYPTSDALTSLRTAREEAQRAITNV